MKIQLEYFIIEFDKPIDYLDQVLDVLKANTERIMNFFNLKNLKNKKRIIIYTDREKYKEHMISCIGYFKEWMCGDTNDGNINLLEISEARKCEDHKDMKIDYFTKCILHEFVHACQQEINCDSDKVEWFWEALATNLSNQEYDEISLLDCDFDKLINDFDNTNNGYDYAYTIGKFMLDNYGHDVILNYIKNPDLLRKDTYNIFNEVKEAQKNAIK